MKTVIICLILPCLASIVIPAKAGIHGSRVKHGMTDESGVLSDNL